MHTYYAKANKHSHIIYVMFQIKMRVRECVFVHTPETAAPIKRAGTSFIKMGSSETVLRASVVVSSHRRGGQRRYSKCVSAKQSARIFFTILVWSNDSRNVCCDRLRFFGMSLYH